jgi:flagellar hook-length control protein FliK
MDLSVALSAPQPVPSPGRVTTDQSPGAASTSDSSGQSFADALAALSDAINGKAGSDDSDVPAATSGAPTIIVPTDLVPGWAGINRETSTPEKSRNDLETGDSEPAVSPDDDLAASGADAINVAALAAAAAADQPAVTPPTPPVGATVSAPASQPATSESFTTNPAAASTDADSVATLPPDSWTQRGESSQHASATGIARRAEHRAAHRSEGARATRRDDAAKGASEDVDVSSFADIENALQAAPSNAPMPVAAEDLTEEPGLGTPHAGSRQARGTVATDLVRAVPGASSSTNDTPSNDSWSGTSSNRSAAAELLARSLRNQAAIKVEAAPHTSELTATVHAPSLFTMNGATLVAPGTLESLSSGLSASTLPGETATQIVQAMRLQVAQGGGTAHIRLEPEHFGELNVTIRVDRGQVVARLEAEVPAVREWLQNNQALLRSNLAEHSLTLDRLEVAESRDARNEQRRDGDRPGNPRGDQPRQRRRKPDTGELFEVVA